MYQNKYLFIPSLLNFFISFIFYFYKDFNEFLGYGLGALLGLFFVLTWFLLIERVNKLSSEKLMSLIAFFFPLKLLIFALITYGLHSYVSFDRLYFAIGFVIGLFINIYIEIYVFWRLK